MREEAASSGVAPAGSGKPPVLVPNMLLLGLNEGAYLLRALGSVRTTELEQALLILPFDAARDILKRLLPLMRTAAPAELMACTALFLLKIHHTAVMADAGLLELLHNLDDVLRARLTFEHTSVGYNLAAMQTVQVPFIHFDPAI